MGEFEYGQYVMYCPGYKDPEIGRVAEDRGRNVLVCYHTGCTAASTPRPMLRPATEEEVGKAPAGLGHNRFNATCPERDEELCRECPARKAVE